MGKFKAPRCPICHKVQRAASAQQHARGEYSCNCTALDYAKIKQNNKDNPISEDSCIEPSNTDELHFTIYGDPAVKKNGMRVVSFGGHSSIRPSVLYEVWASRAIKQILDNKKNTTWKGPLWLKAIFYKRTHRESDLSNLYEGIQDCLSVARVWLDDSLVQSHDGSRKLIDKDNPRIEVTIRRFND